MYKIVETATAIEGVSLTPILTLRDEHGGEVHVCVDDGCYVAMLRGRDGEYRPTPHIFRELHAALAGLPEPDVSRQAAIDRCKG